MSWGANGGGYVSVPSDLTNAVAVAAGLFHSLAVRADGRVVAWGDPYNVSAACDVPRDLTNAMAVSAGVYHSLALKADATVVAWGANSYGQCDVPTDLTNAVAIAAGNFHSLVLQSDGRIVARGRNSENQCNVPVDLTNAVAMDAGGFHSLAVRDDGTVVAWGGNTYGQCDVPSDLTNAVAVAGGFNFSLALRADGSVRVWGDNSSGQCNVPLVLPFVTAVSAGYFHILTFVDPTRAGAVPTVILPPSSQTVAVGSTVSFFVRAVGFPTLRYQWYFGANPIPAATSARLVLTNVHPWQSGAYTVVVRNGAGETTSPPAVLSILPGLDIDMVPAITLKGEVGWMYRLDYVNAVGPTNDWRELATLAITNNPQLYFDTSAIGQPRRFYRLVQVP